MALLDRPVDFPPLCAIPTYKLKLSYARFALSGMLATGRERFRLRGMPIVEEGVTFKEMCV